MGDGATDVVFVETPIKGDGFSELLNEICSLLSEAAFPHKWGHNEHRTLNVQPRIVEFFGSLAEGEAGVHATGLLAFSPRGDGHSVEQFHLAGEVGVVGEAEKGDDLISSVAHS